MAVKSDGKKIFVASTDSDAVSIFGPAGNYLTKFDTFDRNEKFSNPTDMVFDDTDDLLYVADSGNDRIVVFEIVDGATCPSGTREAVDGVCHVRTFGSNGNGKGEFDDPSGLAYDAANDFLYVSDSKNDRIQIIEIVSGSTCAGTTTKIIDGVCHVDEFGSRGSGDGQLDTPQGIALDAKNDLLYVADTKNDRVQAFRLNTEPTAKTPLAPKGLDASAVSPTSIILTWNAPEQSSSVPEITGYKIDYREGSNSYATLVPDTASPVTAFIHEGLKKGESYSYRVYSLNSAGSSSAATASAKPDDTTTPVALTAHAISPKEIKLSWLPPSDTFKQTIKGYTIMREVSPGVYDNTVGTTSAKDLTFTVGNLVTDKTYTYAVSATIGFGKTEASNTASATPTADSTNIDVTPLTSGSVGVSVPFPPIKLVATAKSATEINLSWSAPPKDGNSAVTGYKIESKKGDGDFAVLVADTKDTSTKYAHAGLTPDAKYTYRVSAINTVGTGDPSNESYTHAKLANIEIRSLGTLTAHEEQTLSFAVQLTDRDIKDVVYSLTDVPAALTGAKIDSKRGYSRGSRPPLMAAGRTTLR